MDKSSCGFLILAGGKSSRMGRCKAELPIGEKTFLEYMADKAKNMGFHEILISGYPVPIPGTRSVLDVIGDRGPLGGMYACFMGSAMPSCFVISVDVPLLAPNTVQRLVQAHDTNTSMATLLVHEGRVEPLIGVYNTNTAEKIYEIIKERPASVFSYLDKIGYRTVELLEPLHTITNYNTPAEYEMLKENVQVSCTEMPPE